MGSSVSPSSTAPQIKVTKMLLIVSTVFVCLNLPSCVMRIKTFHEVRKNSIQITNYSTINI